MKNTDTSVLICARNSEKIIENSLIKITYNLPKEIVIIDGCSTDKTIEIAKKYTDKIFSDEGKGLGYARKLGISKINTKLLVIVSPDDEISENFITNASEELLNSSKNTVALLSPKRIKNLKTFFDRGQNEIFKLSEKFKIRTVGNPSIYKTEYLKKYDFDSKFSANEDTDICERWYKDNLRTDWGKTFKTFEIESRNWEEFKSRFIWYGEGDAVFCKKWIKLNKFVALRHFFHPLYTYGLKYPFFFFLKLKISYCIYSIMCCHFRYVGFIKKLKN